MKKDILLIFFIFLYSNTFSQSISFETTYGYARLFDIETQTDSWIDNLEFDINDVQAIYFYGYSNVAMRLKNGNLIYFDTSSEDGQQSSNFDMYYYSPQQTLNVSDLLVNTFMVFPNPTDAFFSISFSPKSSETYNYLIYDSAGKTIRNVDLGVKSEAFIQMVSIENLPSGIYYIQLKSASFSSFKKLIKK